MDDQSKNERTSQPEPTPDVAAESAVEPDATGETVWKKEVSFSRKAVDDEPEKTEPDASEETADPVVPVAASDSGAAPEETVWKKEVSFSRKAVNDEPEKTEPVVLEETVDPVVPVAATESEAAPEEMVWKKEVSFSRKPKVEPQPEPVLARPEDEETLTHDLPVVAEPTADHPSDEVASSDQEQEPAPEERVWKKEVSFSRKAEAEVPVAHEDPVAPEETVAYQEAAPYEEPVAVAEPIALAEPEEQPVAEPVVQPESVAVEEPVVAEIASLADVAAAPEPWNAPAAMPPAPAAEAQPVAFPAPTPAAVVHAPVAAADLPPLPGAETKVPFWKKEISLGGKKRDKAPKERKQKASKVEDRIPDPEPAPAAEALPASDAVTPAVEVHAPVTAADLPPLPADDQKVPFWKKEIGGKKRDKAPKERKQKASKVEDRVPEPEPAPAAEALPASDAVTPAVEVHAPVTAADLPPLPDNDQKVPFWKKEIGGKKRAKALKEPKQKSPKAKSDSAPQTDEPKQPKQPKQRKLKSTKVKAERGGGKGRLVGLKIGASQLAAARVSNNGVAELQQVAREELAPGIVVGGELRDPEALTAALKDFFQKNGLPKGGVRLGIANNRIGVRTFEIAGVQDEKQLGNAIRFRAQEALPIPLDEAVLDYQVLGEGVGEDGRPTKRILLVVAYRGLIDRYVDACKKAGINLVGIDLEAFALLRALQAPQEGVGADPTAALVVVAIGHERSTFAVSDGRVCEFTRVLEWGGSALNVAIARAADAAPSEVEAMKRALALTDETVPEGLTAEQAKKAREAMRRAIQTFARELVSSLQYYQNQPGSLGIGEIVLSGGTAHLPGIAGELERLIGVSVRVGDPLARVKVAKKVGEPEQVGSLAVAIGLGIED